MRPVRRDVPRTMLVRCNPGHAIDHCGEPCAAVPYEGDSTRWVGAMLDYERSRSERRIYFTFDAAADVGVPLTAYYAKKLEEGELLASPNCSTAQRFARA